MSNLQKPSAAEREPRCLGVRDGWSVQFHVPLPLRRTTAVISVLLASAAASRQLGQLSILRKPVGALALLFFIGCNGMSQGARAVFLDRPADTPVTVDIICDVSGTDRSGCSESSLTQLIDTVVPELPFRSVIRLQGMSDTVYAVGELSRHVIAAPRQKTRVAVRRHRVEQTDLVREQFLQAAQPLFGVPRRASPIPQTIARSVLAGNPTGGDVIVLVLSDGRTYTRDTPSLGFIDQECGPPLTVDEFTSRLEPLFPPKSLDGVSIHFVNAQLDGIANDRCAPTIEDYRALRDVWVSSLTRLGARASWSMGPLTSLPKEEL